MWRGQASLNVAQSRLESVLSCWSRSRKDGGTLAVSLFLLTLVTVVAVAVATASACSL